MKRPGISLIIPAYNEEKYLARALGSLQRAQAFYRRGDPIEVIVVNNGSADDTARVARSYGARVVFEKKRQIARARNRGFEVAQGSIISFLDADSYVTPNIFNALEEAMSSSEFIGGGTDIKIDRSSPGIFCTCCLTTYPARYLLGVAGGLIFTERTTFQKLGGFDENLFYGEDSHFILKLKKYGKRIGKKFKVITKDYVMTSARSFDKFGDWYYFRNLPKMLLRGRSAFRDQRIADKFWYDVQR